MNQKSLDDFVAKLGYSQYPGEEKLREYTDAVINNLPQGQSHLFYVTLNVGLSESNINPDQFSSRVEYRKALLAEKRNFLARELAPLRDLFGEIGIRYNQDHILRFLCLNLTKQQALQVSGHGLVKNITAYHSQEPQLSSL